MTAIIVLWILLVIIALIVVLLHFSVTVKVRADNNSFDFAVKYMFFTIYPRKSKRKRTKKSKAKIPDNKKNSNIESERSQTFEDSLDDELEKFISDDQNSAVVEEFTGDTLNTAGEINLNEEKLTEEKSIDLSENKNTQKAVRKRRKIKSDKAEKSEKSANDIHGKLDGLKEKYEMIRPYIPMGWKHFKKLLKTIRFTDVRIDLSVGKEDAYESAIFYGKIQGALFNLIAVISLIFTVKLKQANVNCVFNEKKFDFKAETYIRVRPSTLIAAAVCIGISFLRIFLPRYLAQWKKKRAAMKQNSNAENSAA